MTKISDKRGAILDTALELLVEQGFHNTPMSLIAKQAGVSAGIIYHYFESKEALIHELYRAIKAKYGEALLAGGTDQALGLESLHLVWFNAYNFYVSHPKETMFLEQFENSPFFKQWEAYLDDKALNMASRIQHYIDTGVMTNLPYMVLYNMTLGVARSLAKYQLAGIIDLDAATLEKVARAVSRSVQPE